MNRVKSNSIRIGLGTVLLLSVACRKDITAYAPEKLSGGVNGTVMDESENAFTHPMHGMTDQQELDFFVGNSFFNQNWVSAPASTTARDGLGPLYNARSCSACHFKDGRGAPFLTNSDEANGFLIRLSLPGTDEHGGPLSDPVYGGQLNDLGINTVHFEGKVQVVFEYITGYYDDGSSYELRKPVYTIADPQYGALNANMLLSPRIGQQMIGLGLLEAISESTILTNADASDQNGDGISGRANYVWDYVSGNAQLGRFGWKANQPSLLQQVAGAFVGDLGIKSFVFGSENHTDFQTECLGLPDGGSIEIADDDLMKVVLYASSLAVPARRNVENPVVRQGATLFNDLRCSACHIPSMTTGGDHVYTYLRNQEIHPFSDLLLHDMGAALADDRPDYLATGNEWRTQPLWGLGLIKGVNGHTYLLHDGRARTVEEAILWHGGEAENSTDAFKKLSATEREALLAFLNSL